MNFTASPLARCVGAATRKFSAKFFNLAALTIAAGWLLASTASAATTISGNFRGGSSSSDRALNYTNPYGVVPAPAGASAGTPGAWFDLDQDVVSWSNVGGSTIDITSNTSANGATGPSNTPMRAGILGDVTLTFSDLSASYSSYYLIVYLGGFANAQANVTLTGTTTSGSYLSPTYFYDTTGITATLTQVTSTNSAAPTASGNYAVFGLSGGAGVLTGDSVTVTLDSTVSQGFVGGFQVVGVPEPTALGLLGGSLTLLLARRRRRGPTAFSGAQRPLPRASS